MNSLSLVELIRARAEQGSMPSNRQDGAKIGLVVEGGGMRGVVSGAMIAALENLGFSNCFDSVYGASAGAMAAAFFVAGNASSGATIYYEEINRKRFVNPWRMLTPAPVLNLDFLVFDVFKNKVPLNTAKILNSQVKLNIIATDVATGAKSVLSNFSSEEEVLLALKASASNPMITDGPVEVCGSLYWDAILSESIPVRSALEDNCTHVVVLRSRPSTKPRSTLGIIEKFLARIFIKKHSEASYVAYCGKFDSYENERKLVDGLGSHGLIISPSEDVKVSQVSASRSVLLAAAIDGYARALDAFSSGYVKIGPKIGHF